MNVLWLPRALLLMLVLTLPTHAAPSPPSAQKARLNEALMDAVSFNPMNIALIKRLLAEGADPTAMVHSPARNEALSAYQFAIEDSKADLVALFLGRGTPVNFRVHDEDDPHIPRGTLDWAASRRADARTMKVLLAHGADRRYLNHALLIAASTADPAVVRLLLDAGAHVNYRDPADSWGETPLLAAVHGDNTDANVVQTMRLLLLRGANVNARDSHGMTALMGAAGDGDEVKVRLLLSHRANLRLVNVWGETALGRATKYNQPAMVQLLRKTGAKE